MISHCGVNIGFRVFVLVHDSSAQTTIALHVNLQGFGRVVDHRYSASSHNAHRGKTFHCNGDGPYCTFHFLCLKIFHMGVLLAPILETPPLGSGVYY